MIYSDAITLEIILLGLTLDFISCYSFKSAGVFLVHSSRNTKIWFDHRNVCICFLVTFIYFIANILFNQIF